MAIDSVKKSSRFLQSRRYTHETLLDSQEAFTSTLDINSSEVYTDAALIPSSSLPFSGSSQDLSIYSSGGRPIMRYYYRKKLTKSDLNNEVWFFTTPSGSSTGIGAQLLNAGQQGSFISPKYSLPSLSNSNTEDNPAGYLAKVFVSTNESTPSAGDQISVNNYAFDYKTGVLEFSSSAVMPNNSQYVYISVYQYVGNTLLTSLASLTGSFSGSITGSIFGTASQAISSSYSYTASSAISSSFASTGNGIFSGSFSGSFQGNLANLKGTVNYLPIYDTANSLATSSVYQSGSYSIIINQTDNTNAAPEALYVWQPNTSSYNVISGKGNSNNYLQLNIQNVNAGVSSSSDVVATANNGNESINYINMGINGANFSGPIGDANDAYLYSAGNHLHIGNITANKPVQFFAGGTNTNATRKFELNTNNQHNMTGSLNISGSLTVTNGITGSLFGTASQAVSASYAFTASSAISSSLTQTASFALRGSGSFTGSFSGSFSGSLFGTASQATSASYAYTASSAIVASASLIAVSASYAYTASSAILASASLISVSSSYAFTASSAISSSFAQTASSVTTLVQPVLISGSFTVVTGSGIEFQVTNTGTKIGNLITDSHNITGSLSVLGSITGSLSGSLTGSLFGTSSQTVSASYAYTASSAIVASASLTAVSASYAFTASSAISSSLSQTASFSLGGSGSFTGSFSGSFSGSLFGTASQSVSASYAFTASSAIVASASLIAISASYAYTASSAIVASASLIAVSSSYAFTASSAILASASLIATSASYAYTASSATRAFSSSYSETSSFANNFTVANTLTAQTIVVTTVSSSVVYSSGSNVFGNNLSNTQVLTGSVGITGSLTLRGNEIISGSSTITGSLSITGSVNASQGFTGSLFGTASQAVSASYAYTASSAIVASASLIAVSASYAYTASSAIVASASLIAVSASYAFTASSALRSSASLIATSASYAFTASSAISASYAQTASFLLGYVSPFPFTGSAQITGSLGVTGSFSVSGSSGTLFSSNADTLLISGSLIVTGSTSITGSLSVSGSITGSLFGTASQATSASYAYTASSAILASASLIATSASYAYTASSAILASASLIATSASYAFTASSAISASLSQTASFALRGSGSFTGSFSGSFSGSLFGTASQAVSASYAYTASSAILASASLIATSASYAYTASSAIVASASLIATSASYAFTASSAILASASLIATSASYAFTASSAISASIAQTASFVNPLRQTLTLTGSLNVSGSTTQIGVNNLLGNTLISGSLIISGALGQPNPTVSIFGDLNQTGYTRYLPVVTNLDTNISASYIFVSGSTQDLYFSQNNKGYNNVTRLRWLEGNLYTGLLHGGVITSQSSTVYQVSSGSGIIVDLNASLSDDPYPTVQYLNWGNLSQSIAPLSASYDQAFVGVDNTGNIFQQGVPFSDGQFDTLINLGLVLFQNHSTINGFKTQPSVAYGFEQAQNTFNRAFGPLKLSGYTVAVSGSSTGSIIVGSGTAYAPGSNYAIDPNNPSYTIDNGTNTSKFFRYYQSGSGVNPFVYLTNGGAGYPNLDPVYYNNNGTLNTVGGGNYSIQRLFWYPNSVTKAVVAYYGNAIYGTMSEALANLNVESFVEAPNTAASAIYLGAYAIKGGTNTTLQNPAHFTWIPGGLFRSVGGSGGGGSIVTQTLAGLSDVSISGQTNGQPLVYNSTSGKWQNQSTLIATLTGNADTATSASYAISASYAFTASSAIVASASLIAVSASYAFTASSAISASFAVNYLGSGSISTRLTNLETASGSFSTRITSDSSSFSSRVSSIETTTASLQLASASFSTRTTVLEGASGSFSTRVTQIERTYATTGSNIFTGSQNILGAITASAALINGTLTAQTLVVTTVSSSVVYSSGSNIFGNATTNTQTMTGSLNVSGSATIIGRVTATDLTGSLFGTASWATNFITGSVTSASFAFTASSAISSSFASTASFLNTLNQTVLISGSFTVVTGSGIEFQVTNTGIKIGNLITDSHNVTGSLTVLGSITGSLSGSVTGSLFGTSSQATSASYAFTASSAISSSYAFTASSAINAFSASNALTASFVNTLNQNVVITGSLIIGTGSGASSESTLALGPAQAGGAGEGGQLLLMAKVQDGYTSASMLDTYQNRFRLLKGTNTGSIGEILSANLNTGQVAITFYQSAASFPGTVAANLAVDSGGNILTVAPGTVTSASYAYTASSAEKAFSSISSSYALTASFALNGGGGAAFPFTGSAQITGSLGVSGSLSITSGSLSGSDARFSGILTIQSASLDYGENTSVTLGAYRVIASEATSSYRAAFFDYVMFSGSVVRAGTVTSTWSGSSTEYYENYTADLGGSTSGVTLQTALSTGNIQLQASSSTSAWTIRSLIRLL